MPLIDAIKSYCIILTTIGSQQQQQQQQQQNGRGERIQNNYCSFSTKHKYKHNNKKVEGVRE